MFFYPDCFLQGLGEKLLPSCRGSVQQLLGPQRALSKYLETLGHSNTCRYSDTRTLGDNQTLRDNLTLGHRETLRQSDT